MTHKKFFHLAFFIPIFLLSVSSIYAQGTGAVVLPRSGLLPGNPLYPAKILLESFQEFFTFDPTKKALLEMQFATKRIAELKEILETEGLQSSGIKVAQVAFQKHVGAALDFFEESSDDHALNDANAQIDALSVVAHESVRAAVYSAEFTNTTRANTFADVITRRQHELNVAAQTLQSAESDLVHAQLRFTEAENNFATLMENKASGEALLHDAQLFFDRARTERDNAEQRRAIAAQERDNIFTLFQQASIPLALQAIAALQITEQGDAVLQSIDDSLPSEQDEAAQNNFGPWGKIIKLFSS